MIRFAALAMIFTPSLGVAFGTPTAEDTFCICRFPTFCVSQYESDGLVQLFHLVMRPDNTAELRFEHKALRIPMTYTINQEGNRLVRGLLEDDNFLQESYTLSFGKGGGAASLVNSTTADFYENPILIQHVGMRHAQKI